MVAHGAQFGQVEFEADHKHQKHHTKLAQMAHPVGIFGQCQRVRTNHHADRQIAQHRRQFQVAAGHHAKHGSQQIQKRQIQWVHGADTTKSAGCAGR